MSVIRRRHTGAYATVPNAVANDDRLSFAERGLLVYLLAKPEGWAVNVTDLQKQGGIGRDLAYKLLSGLIDRGYVRRERIIDPATKRVIGVEYDVFDAPAEPLPEKPEVDQLPEKPDTALPDTANQDAYKRQTLTKTDYLFSGREGARDPVAELCEVLDELHAEAVLQHFAGLGTPLTPYTARLKADQLDKFADPNAAAEELVANGWRNLKPHWVPEHRSAGERSKPADPVIDHVHVSRSLQPDLYRACCEATGHAPDVVGKRGGWAFDRMVVERAQADAGGRVKTLERRSGRPVP